MASLNLTDALGAVTGSEAARAKLAGALFKVQGALESKASVLGAKLPFLGSLPAALAKGTTAARAAEVDTLAKEQIGISLTDAKALTIKGFAIAAVLGSLAVLLLWRRRGA